MRLTRLLGLVALVVLALQAVPVRAARLDFPYFLNVHIEQHRSDSRIIIDSHYGDATYGNVRWTSQPGVAKGDYCIRVDSTGFVRSLDAKLSFFRQTKPSGSGLVVTILSPGANGSDTFSYDVSVKPMRRVGETHTGLPGNRVDSVDPCRPVFSAPFDFEFHVGQRCRPNQFLQVSTQWLPTEQRSPEGIGLGTYRVRLNADGSVVPLDGNTSFGPVPTPPQDRAEPNILGLLIAHSCDPKADGVDISGYDRDPRTGTLSHQTTWEQRIDAGYGWQPYGALSSEPREFFAAGNWIVIHHTPPQLLDGLSRLAGVDRIGTAVAISANAFGGGAARAAVLARADNFPDALAGTPLAVAKGGPLLLTGSAALDGRVEAELRRAVPTGRTVYLLGGTGALSDEVEQRVTALGYQVTRIAGSDRYDTAAKIANDGLGGPQTVFLTTGTNFPDALAAGTAAAKAGGAVLLTAGASMPPQTAAYVATRPASKRFAVGGPAAAADPTATPLVGTDRFSTAVKVAERFFPSPTTIGVASGITFPDALAGGVHAARAGGPLLLASTANLPGPAFTYVFDRAHLIRSAALYGGLGALTDSVVGALQWAVT